MPIARKPGARPAAVPDEAAEQFIARAGASPAAAANTEQPEPSTGDAGGRRRPAMIRFDRALLDRIDQAARRRGISRSAWVQYTVSRALDEEG